MEVASVTRHQTWHIIVYVKRVMITFSITPPSLASKIVRIHFYFSQRRLYFISILYYVLCFQPIILTSCKFTPNLWFVKKQKLSPTKCPWCIMDFHLIFVHYVNKDSKKWHITLHVKLNIITCHFLLDLLIK